MFKKLDLNLFNLVKPMYATLKTPENQRFSSIFF